MLDNFFKRDPYEDEDRTARALLDEIDWSQARAESVQKDARKRIRKIRKQSRNPVQLENFLQQYSLNSEEGLALMCLAEALLRIPDSHTANELIRDKIAAANWLDNIGGSQDWIVKAAGVGLLMTRKTLNSALSRLGQPVIRQAMVRAMQMMGGQFVLGQTIEDAHDKARPYEEKGYRMSYDMLGEGARTADDAEHFFKIYQNALDVIVRRERPDHIPTPGMSVKLSALHPRYHDTHRDICVPVIQEKLESLIETAIKHDIALTVDAEENDRLLLSLDVIRPFIGKSKSWEGFGLAVQAYNKRSPALIDALAEYAAHQNTRLQVRLVKGAYWDTEIKHAQLLGVNDFPVFTRKAATDTCYLLCAQKMLQQKAAIMPLFGTHNVHTISAILEMSDNDQDFEFQRLHGMGESAFDLILADTGRPVSIYAPVGPHKDLLPYLVRRLLENGANSSFVHQLLDETIKPSDLTADPVYKLQQYPQKSHPQIRRPAELYAHETLPRANSKGFNWHDRNAAQDLLSDIRRSTRPWEGAPLINGQDYRHSYAVNAVNPGSHDNSPGRIWFAREEEAEKAVTSAQAGFSSWQKVSPEERALALEKWAALLEENRAELLALCIAEAGKTLTDGIAEIREAVDFLRYYANRGRLDFADQPQSAPTGERNILRLEGRGVFACISPWNFPLAIFTGQIAAALMAGNTVVAKPAEQTPLIACKAVNLAHKAGIPPGALNLVPGDGRIGAHIIARREIAGVAFTGSLAAAKDIHHTLSQKDGPIVPLIAETGGQNAMIVDSSALPEQVIDDVLLSAFGSAGQRCSALRVLYLQEEIADKVIDMLRGAMAELVVGPPGDLQTDIGPIIDQDALSRLISHRTALSGFGKLIFELPLDPALKNSGFYFAPCAYEIPSITALKEEVFGPVLHVVRYDKKNIDDVIDDINSTGYGLTFGVHSRIDNFQKAVADNVAAGNIYVNRSMTGAIVGSQPFGGRGLSGTGPKAGGPHYLPRFADEKLISTDTTAAGGNASLVSLED